MKLRDYPQIQTSIYNLQSNYMSDRQKSFSGSKFGKGSNIVSGLVVQSHLKSIMPSLRGGKNENDIKYLHIRVQDNLEHSINLEKDFHLLLSQLGEAYYDYKVFKDKSQILEEFIKDQDLLYIFLKEELASWGEDFARQEIKQSQGRKSISIVQFLRKHKYEQKVQERRKIIQKNRRDPNQNIVYYINLDGKYLEEIQQGLIQDINNKLTNKLRREGNKVKTWSLGNKYKQKKTKRQRLYIYIESSIAPKIQYLYKRFRKKSGFKWTQIISFATFEDLLKSIKKRQDQLVEEVTLMSQISINPVSKIFDKSQSGIKSMSIIGGPSSLGSPKSTKNLIQQKMQAGLRSVDKNFIIHSNDFEESDKIYQFVMGQKDNNWQKVVYEDKNFPKMKELADQIGQNEQQGEKDQYLKIITAPSLYIMTFSGDEETHAIFGAHVNTFNNRYLLDYQSEDELLTFLNNYSRNDDAFTIVIINYQGSSEDSYVSNFMQKNQLTWENILVLYKKANDLNESLSMNSKLSINDEKDVNKYLEVIMQDRDRQFSPFQCYKDNNVYIMFKEQKDYLVDEELNQRIVQSARLMKKSYQDANYLKSFLDSIQLKRDSAIIIAEDNDIRQIYDVVKESDNANIANVTDRKNVPDRFKVLAWGTYPTIKQAIFNITDKARVTMRKEYKKNVKDIECKQNPIPRKMPKNIPFRDGNNITVRLSSLETDPDSAVMEQNLNHYFKEEIRIENYKNPKDIRLTNKLEQPLSFIICRDDKDELDYMKKIAKQQKSDLRQQYILFTKEPKKYIDTLFKDKNYERFRFISNSWQRIEEYIIGLYQNIRDIKNQDNDTILQDELVHVFYHQDDTHLPKMFNDNFRNSLVYPNVKFHDFRALQWVALEQSPHHLYYILVDEINGKQQTSGVLKQIKRVEAILDKRKVAPKKMKMLVIKKETGAMRDKYMQGTFEEGQKALNYISNTRIQKITDDIVKPHILIDKNSQDWYYFLDKHLYKNRYHFHYINSLEEAVKLIMGVRATEVGSQFWYITSNQKDLSKFLEISNNIEQGLRIYAIYKGSLSPGISLKRLIFTHPSRDQIEAFILNSHKRSQTIFSPESLRKKNPVLAISNANKQKIPVDPTEIRKWRQDLGAEQFNYDNFNQLRRISGDRNIFLVTDAQEHKNLSKNQEYFPNLWWIIFDTNEENRKKAHSLLTIYSNAKQAYYGYYPAQIRQYLSYLRYNIKNSPEKLMAKYNSELINVYIQKELSLAPGQLQLLLKTNKSIANVWSFESSKPSIQNSINHSLTYPNYTSIFIFSNQSEYILNQIPQRPNINYIVYNENFRTAQEARSTDSVLISDESKQLTTYLFNLPERRYDTAKNYQDSAPLKLMYLNNGKLDNQVRNLTEINKRSSNFTILPYKSLDDLAYSGEKLVVLTDPVGYQAHLDQLKLRNNITYFVLGENRSRNLVADPAKSEYFVSKENQELTDYFNNLKIADTGKIRMPTVNLPSILNNSNFKFSRPLAFKSGFDLSKIRVLPEFKKDQHQPEPEFKFNQNNFIDSSKRQIFLQPAYFGPDSSLAPLFLRDFITQIDPARKIIPLPLNLDYPPSVMEDKFNSKPDLIETIPKQLVKQSAKEVERKLAIVHPAMKEFKQIFRILQSNLYPKTFSRVQSIPYSSDYDFESLARNQTKFMGFDRTVLFLTPKMIRYSDQLKLIQNKMKGKLQYYFFNDNFHRVYDGFKQFLQPYIINSQQIPYINREDPKFWLRSNHYNVIVPLEKKKKYNSMKGQNISVIVYSDQDGIEKLLHQSGEFVVIVCEKKDYNEFKKFPRMSPRCIIVIQDTEQLKQDEVPLMRYPKKVLYYGPDALNYLAKIRIPSRNGPFFPDVMKVLFFNKAHSNEEDYAEQQEFDEYQKVPYGDAQDLFFKLIQNFKTSSNFKVPQSLVAKDLIKLHPKIYVQKKIQYMNKYLNQYSASSPMYQVQFKRSFNRHIKPEQYLHLPIFDYENVKDLKQVLEKQESPCLVFIDQERSEIYSELMRHFRHKHLFIEMFDLFDIWIDRDGHLIPSHKLSRPELGIKQTLFSKMFDTWVFQTYNDMGYYYLSNSKGVIKKKVMHRNENDENNSKVEGSKNDRQIEILKMTKEELWAEFNNNRNKLMVIFVEHTDRKWIPSKFYDPQRDASVEQRVKLIFLHHTYIHNENTLYIKFSQIDPVILHIDRVEMRTRTDFCLYPDNAAGEQIWHRFASTNTGYQTKKYTNMEDIDYIAQDIKGKFRKVWVICEKQDQQYIKEKLAQYSIKTKKNTGEEVKFWEITESDKRSYLIRSEINKSNINLNGHSEENEEKFETAGHQVDIKGNSSNAYYNSNIKENNASLEDVVESKNFIINLSENLKDSFPVGNLYTNGVKHFKNIKSVDMNSPLNQLIVTNQNLNEVKGWVQNNPKLFLIYVSDQVPAGKEGNAIVIKEEEVPKFINKLEGIQRTVKKNDTTSNNANLIGNSSNTSNYNSHNYNSNTSHFENDLKIGGKNVEDFKVVKIFYDENLDKGIKKQILLAAFKNKNFRPYLFKDLDTLKRLMKQEGSLSLLLVSKDPPNLKQELEKQNYTIIKNKKGKKMIVPRFFNPGIDGLSTILEEEESEFEKINQDLNEHVDRYLAMMEKNPEKGRKNILAVTQEQENQDLLDHEEIVELQQQQEWDKLNVHSNINVEGNNEGGNNREWIKQRLDGGVLVLFVEKGQAEKVIEVKNKYNVLIQEYSHSINLNNSIREKKDKFTVVLVDPNMLTEVKQIKEQHPKTVFVLLNSENREISPKDKANISFEITSMDEIEPIMAEIHEENEKIKYNDHAKMQSKMDNKRTSFVDNGNSWRLSTGYHNTRVKNAFVFCHEDKNKDLIKKVQNMNHMNHITFVKYKDLGDAQKKFNSYSGYQIVLIANDNDIPQFEDYIMKKKEGTYIIRLNPLGEYRENPKIRKNIVLQAHTDKEVADYLVERFGEHTKIVHNQQRPKEGKSYAPRYQPNMFGTTPRFVSQKDYVPYKNDPIYSSRAIKSVSRESKVLRTDGSSRELTPKNTLSPYYNR